ncbi:AAA family ATPase [Raoultibacter timonensis]|uniref:ATP-binding protein n=1 Tax=Raoultibacter timonensis TaxID=1907662 RepID=A0ABN6MA23_9ACTN|nr:AAA family ATPase [Raoultibacter timonensis]BDE94912.1 ATP-binding protein [Raoultibacter timonensis]BDF49515.1 ATP-binding protein [Raoultibacter timonensis]
MANLICVMGESGSGKTTSLRNLDPKSTYIIDCDKKGLSWRNWGESYGGDKKNYSVTDDQQKVMALLKSINANAPHIKTVVIDTINGIMVADENRRKDEKNYDKWSDLAWAVYGIIDYALTMRPDITVVFMAHAQTERDDSGVLFTRIKTSGKKLDKICLESKFTTVLNSKCVNGEYVFETRNELSTAKTPIDSFKDQFVPNDIASVDAVLREYWGLPPLGGDAK